MLYIQSGLLLQELRKYKVIKFAVTWMNFESIFLSHQLEMRDTQKDLSYVGYEINSQENNKILKAIEMKNMRTVLQQEVLPLDWRWGRQIREQNTRTMVQQESACFSSRWGTGGNLGILVTGKCALMLGLALEHICLKFNDELFCNFSHCDQVLENI